MNSTTPAGPPAGRPPFDWLRFWLVVLVVIIIVGLLRRCYLHKTTTPTPVPSPVVVLGKTRTSDVPVYLSALGSVVPTYSVTVKTQINGRLLEVLFKEGQNVKVGELLALIDPSPYKAMLLQYQGQLERDQALLENAKADVVRYQTLWKQDSVAKQILDTQLALVKQYEGVVKLDQGLVEGIQVNLKYCRIISPIDGRIGLRLVDPGNYVQTSDATGMAVINMLTPITVVFTLPEDYLSKVIDQLKTGAQLPVYAYNRAQNKLLAKGTLLTMDNQIDATTGTVKLKALFQNKEQQLFPNQFVNVKLLIKTLRNATVVPTAAVQHGVQDNFVYLLNPDQTVSVKPVVTSVTFGNETTVVSGLTSGQSVVVDGADRLTEGMKVTVYQAPPIGKPVPATDRQKLP